jgi:hypothetical protein
LTPDILFALNEPGWPSGQRCRFCCIGVDGADVVLCAELGFRAIGLDGEQAAGRRQVRGSGLSGVAIVAASIVGDFRDGDLLVETDCQRFRRCPDK